MKCDSEILAKAIGTALVPLVEQIVELSKRLDAFRRADEQRRLLAAMEPQRSSQWTIDI
jgi:hypothetical protein